MLIARVPFPGPSVTLAVHRMSSIRDNPELTVPAMSRRSRTSGHGNVRPSGLVVVFGFEDRRGRSGRPQTPFPLRETESCASHCVRLRYFGSPITSSNCCCAVIGGDWLSDTVNV